LPFSATLFTPSLVASMVQLLAATKALAIRLSGLIRGSI
jgi:hypothetical protein